MSGWIGVDLDGTLARYTGWMGYDHIGAPIAPMVERVKKWLAEGKTVKIFTARLRQEETDGAVYDDADDVVPAIERWCLEHIGVVLPVTNVKDYGMIELWDDRAVRVVTNTGRPCCYKHGVS